MSKTRKTSPARCASGWLGEVVTYAIFGLILMPALWTVSNRLNEPWAYTARGIALMLWPCQWAFWLGRKSAFLPNKADITNCKPQE